MLLTGKFKHKEKEYEIAFVEKETIRRIDLFTDKIKLNNPKNEDLVFSVSDNLITGEKEYFGDLDIFYSLERLMREARLYRFKEEEIEEYDDFEEGKVIFVCNQKNERFEYNYKSENTVKVYRYMRTPESYLEISLTDEAYSTVSKHLTIRYARQEVSKSDFNEDSIVLSRIATISELREKYDLGWLKDKEYIWMEDMNMLKKYLLELKKHIVANPKEALLVVDTETTGLNIYNLPNDSGERDKLVSIVLTWKEDFSLYIPIAHKYEENLPEQEVIKILAPFLEKVPILTQYGLFDYKVFMDYKTSDDKLLKVNIKHDLLLQNYILQPNPKASNRSLKDNVWKKLGIKQLSLSDLFPATKDGGKTEIRFELLPRETALVYACPDVDLLLKLHRMTYIQVPDISKPIYKTEVGFMPIAAEAEYYGLKINMEMFQAEKKLCEELTYQLQEVVYKLAGYRFNLNSPDQVSNFLYNKLGCDILISSKTNPAKGSTSSKALKNLSKVQLDEPIERFKTDMIQEVKEDGKIIDRRLILESKKLNRLKYPAVLVLMEYRNYSKLLTGFFNSIEESNKGGRLFSWVNQTGAQTGRIISPLQTLPPFIKKMIIPDTSEHGFIVMDYKQIELRLMFGLAKETALIEESTDPDKDIHRIVAARIYQMKLWEIYKDLRSKSKGLNFGIPYSLGDYSLATTLYGYPKNDKHKEEIIEKARDDKRRFFEAMPRVERLFIDAKNFIKEHGCIYTLLGRGYYYETIFEETNRGKIARFLRQGSNGMIQGLGADVFKKGTVDYQSRIKARDWDKLVKVTNKETGENEGEFPLVRQAFFVHDELGTVYHKKSINPVQVIYELVKTMQIKLDGFPPLYIGPAVVTTWGDAKKDKYEIPTMLLEQWCQEVESGMHTEPLENPEDWVYGEIVKFNKQGYLEYYEELKQQLRKEGKEVTAENISKIFRHDTITHDMIAIYDDKQYENEFGRSPSHVELVEWAVIKYIEDNDVLSSEDRIDLDTLTGVEVGETVSASISLESMLGLINPDINSEDYKIPSNVIPFESISQFELDKEEMLEFADDLDEFSNPIDVNTPYEFDDTDDDLYSEEYYKYSNGNFSKEEYDLRSEEIKEGFSKHISTIARNKVIKLDMVNPSALRILTEYLKEQHREDGLYGVSFMQSGRLHETSIKVDRVDDTLVDLILSKSAEELEKLFNDANAQ